MTLYIEKKNIAVLGSGAFGTALAATACKKHNVSLYGRRKDLVDNINQKRENTDYLPGEILPKTLHATNDIAHCLKNADYALITIPAQMMRKALINFSNHIRPELPLIICAKGIAQDNKAFMSQIVQEILPQNPFGLLSGPGFALDIIKDLPTAITLCAPEIEQAMEYARVFSHKNFRCYASDDIKGVEIGGAFKNVFAIAAGICAGKNLGESAIAALITRAFAELRRIGCCLGARKETLMGLSGFGDLYLTCSSEKSRNFSYGIALAKGQIKQNTKLTEGVKTAPVAYQICQKYNIDAPIITTIYQLLSEKITIIQAIDYLCNRPLRLEEE